nr:hypothetical protein [Tanacetum cinerariifolium]
MLDSADSFEVGSSIGMTSAVHNIALRGVVLGGSGTKGRELAEKLALRQVGAAVRTDKLVNFTEVLGVIARVSKNVHRLCKLVIGLPEYDLDEEAALVD